MDFVIKQHMLLKRRESDSSCAPGVERSPPTSPNPTRGGIETKGGISARVLRPCMNFQSNECSYSLTSCVSFTPPFKKNPGRPGPGLKASARFIPRSTALPFTSCHRGQRALTSGVQPIPWIIHDIDLFFFFPPCLLFFFLFFSSWLCCGSFLLI